MGILQARVLEWVANSYSEDLPNPGIKPMSLMSPMHRQKGSVSLAPRGKPHSNLCRKPNFQLPCFLYQRKILIGKGWNLKTCDGKIFMAILENTEIQNPLNFLSLQKPATLLGQTASVPTFSLAEDVKRLHLKQMLCKAYRLTGDHPHLLSWPLVQVSAKPTELVLILLREGRVIQSWESAPGHRSAN